MATEFKLPELGENVDAGTVASVLVKSGDSISKNQAVLEVETDKAVAEIPCPLQGTVKEVRVNEGDTVKAGQVILLVEEGTAKSEKKPEDSEEKPEDSEEEAAVSKKEPEPESAPAPAEKAAPAPAPRKSGAPVLASPSVRRLAREHGVKLEDIPTSDPSGRITPQDILLFVEGGAALEAPIKSASKSEPATAAPSKTPAETDQDGHGPVLIEPMNAIRKKSSTHLTNCWTTIPHVTQFDKADITDLETYRKQMGPKVENAGGRLTLVGFVLKVLVEAFKKYPQFNASVDMKQQQVILKQYYNIGVAVETPFGLVVPVIRDADQKSVTDISIELPALAAKARERKLSLEEMQGGTFTVSNLGGLGGTGFTPIINAPEVAILGMSRSAVEPVYKDGEFVPRTLLPLSLSYDHRIIDGADAARFLRYVCQALELPWSMYLG